MNDQTSQQPDEIDALITAAVNAAFDCGEWNEDEKEKYDTYLPLAEKAQVAREKLSAAIAALKHAQQAVESERDKALGQIVDDLPALVRRLVRALNRAAPDRDLTEIAMDYLKRHGLQGSPLRGQKAVEIERIREVNNVTARGLYFDSERQHELERDGPTEEEMLTLLADDDQRRRDEIRDEALESAAKICDGVNNYDNPMTARDCADAIRALKGRQPAQADKDKP